MTDPAPRRPADPAPARPANPAPARPADPAPARPAATVLLLRDAPDGLEVFMVQRNRQIDFAGGALVFPGGRVEADDAEIAAQVAPADPLGRFRVAAVREAFEECGVLLARGPDGAPILAAHAAAVVAGRRPALCAGELTFGALLDAEALVPDLAALTHFAHWITPRDLAKRFDTHFFLAVDPGGQVLAHDGNEAVDSLWLRPETALTDAAAGRATLVFATRLNLIRLGQSASAAAAIAAAGATSVVTVEPAFVDLPEGPHMRIAADAGYGGPLFPAGKRAM